MISIGETLRRERMRRNLDLDQIARETKISPKLLEAIEAEQFEKLPGGVFAKSFVRQYARVLGLDEDELVGELGRVLEPVPVLSHGSEYKVPKMPAQEIALPRVEEWQQFSDGRFKLSSSLPALAMVVLVMLVCSGVYAWWQRSRTRAVTAPELPAAHTTQRETSPPAPVPTPAPPTEPSAAATAPSPGPAGLNTPTQGPNPSTASPQTPVTEAPSAAAPQPSTASPPGTQPAQAAAEVPKPQPNPNAKVHVTLTAEEPVWVRAQADGKLIFSATLQTNETRALEAEGNVVMRLGNAGGVAITLNGKPLGPVGPKGQVRTIQLTQEGFQIVPPAVAPKPPDPVVSDPL